MKRQVFALILFVRFRNVNKMCFIRDSDGENTMLSDVSNHTSIEYNLKFFGRYRISFIYSMVVAVAMVVAIGFAVPVAFARSAMSVSPIPMNMPRHSSSGLIAIEFEMDCTVRRTSRRKLTM